MKYAIAIETTSTESRISKKFGISPVYILYDKGSKTLDYLHNPFFEGGCNRGKNIITLLIEHQVECLVGFEYGSNLQNITNEKGIQLILVNNLIRKAKDIIKLLEQ